LFFIPAEIIQKDQKYNNSCKIKIEKIIFFLLVVGCINFTFLSLRVGVNMTGNFENKLSAEGITLPDAPAPAANYVPYVQVGNVLYVSGQISQNESGLILGKLGENMTTEQGAEAAKFCAMSLLAQVKSACNGDLDKLVRVIKLTGFVNSTPDFTQQPQVINGASDLLGNVLGDAGKHARVAVSANSLPLGVAVEIDGIFQIS
jgi:enamine deaminase RidA (YjgF/YER057c/UK114 family)